MSHHQLTQYHRHELGALLVGGKHSLREIAHILGFHHSTISRELQRHPAGNPSGYHAVQARLQLKATRLHANQHHRKLPTNTHLVTVVTERLLRHDSPDQIAGWFKNSGAKLRVCAQTIYDWIYTYATELVIHLHCRKGKYRRTRENTLRKAFRNKLKEARSIDVTLPYAKPTAIGKATVSLVLLNPVLLPRSWNERVVTCLQLYYPTRRQRASNKQRSSASLRSPYVTARP
jgi:IS30 family transposase